MIQYMACVAFIVSPALAGRGAQRRGAMSGPDLPINGGRQAGTGAQPPREWQVTARKPEKYHSVPSLTE